MFVVFDLDGTIALNAHRQHFLDREPKDWDAWHRACVDDVRCWPVVRTLHAMLPYYRVEIWSARKEIVRAETDAWLEANSVPAKLLTRMRPADDNQPDVDLKRKWLHEARAHGGAPDLVFDDRDRVVAMWRAEGIVCCQVAPGAF